MEIRFPLILDGATGTELQKHGYAGDVSAEQWTLAHPDIIREIQRGYVAAGSRVLYTPTFGANRQKLEERGIFNRTADFNRRLAALSREAADGRAWIAGDLAPTGLFLAPLGEASFEDLVDIYTEQAAGLEEAGVDLFVIETMMTLSDARAAVLAVRSVSDKPIFVSFTCDESGRSLSGTDVTAALTVLQGMGISAFGLNCSTGPEQMLVQLRRLHEYARVPLIAKPNAGMPITVGGKTVYDCTPEDFTAYVPAMLEAGVAVFGGCCGTTAAHIARAALEGIAYQTLDIVGAMQRDSGITLRELKVDGGAARNDLLMQFQSDLLDTRVIRPSVTETTALGAAYLAGLAVGYWDSIDDIKRQWQAERIFEPTTDRAHIAEAVEGWKDAVRRVLRS